MAISKSTRKTSATSGLATLGGVAAGAAAGSMLGPVAAAVGAIAGGMAAAKATRSKSVVRKNRSKTSTRRKPPRMSKSKS